MFLIIIGILLIFLCILLTFLFSYYTVYHRWWSVNWVILFCGIACLSISIGTCITAKMINNREVGIVIETPQEFDVYLTDGTRSTIEKRPWLNWKFSESSDVINIKWDKKWGVGYTDLVLPLDKIEKIETEDKIIAAAQPNCDGKAGAA